MAYRAGSEARMGTAQAGFGASDGGHVHRSSLGLAVRGSHGRAGGVGSLVINIYGVVRR